MSQKRFFDIEGVESVNISGHKFFGTPYTCAVYVEKK